jgi:hypothetical protein
MMPEFDSFTQGYLDCAEWLLDKDVDRSKLRGWTKKAIKEAVDVCVRFQVDHMNDLERYQEVTGRDANSAGVDFFLTRNGHDTGFWDRGDDPCLDRLTDASQCCGEVYTTVTRGWIHWD